MTKSKFDLFIGIDWSGAKDGPHSNIQVAEAKPDDTTPKIIPMRREEGWYRTEVLDYIKEQAEDKKVLVGFDFAFAHPYTEAGCCPGSSPWQWPLSSVLDGYYPGARSPLSHAAILWQMIEDINYDRDDLYGGGIWEDSNYGHFYNRPKTRGGCGKKFQPRLRRTEMIAAAFNDCTPSSTFGCSLPGQVGTGSLAGMRMLHRLRSAREASIWPMETISDANLTVVEIYPALYFAKAKITKDEKEKAKLSKAEIKEAKADDEKRKVHLCKALKPLNRALAERWNSREISVEEIPEELPIENIGDAIDALISAAALRVLGRDGLPHLPDEVMDDARREGWILGVKPPKKTAPPKETP